MIPPADMTAVIAAVEERLSRAPVDNATHVVLKSNEFRKSREQNWRDLETLVVRFERRGVGALSLDELQRLPILYRAALSSLSVARTIALDRNLLLYLENLALRAFLVVYAPRINPLEGVRNYFDCDLPRAVRAARWHIALATFAMLVGVAVGLLLTLQDEAWFTSIVPAGLAAGRGPSSTQADLQKVIFQPWPGAAASFGVFAGFLFNHNTLVGILTFGLGLAAAVPTILLCVYNGLMLGTFLAIHYDRDLLLDFIGWVAIHGTTELAALILFAAGGLVIAEKMLFPGSYTRLENLALHGRQAALMAVGAIFMLFVAAMLEGGCRQLVQSTSLRLAIGLAMAALWITYFCFSGREAKR
jgi:uncharacterized membrane protein SpoIIM required for sporulation